MYTIQPSTTAGTDLRAEFTRYPKVGNCSNCGTFLSETFTVGYRHRGKTIEDPSATAVIVRRASRSNPKLARTIETLCAGCARHAGFVSRFLP